MDESVHTYSLEAERAVIGGIITVDGAWDRIADRVKPGDFYSSDHRLLFGAARDLAAASKPIDVITVSESLEKMYLLEDAGGLPYIVSLARETPGASNIEAYADIVKQHAQRRKLIAASAEIANLATQDPDVNDAIARAQTLLDDVSGDAEISHVQHIGEALSIMVDAIDERFHSKNKLIGVPTGFKEIDNALLGLRGGKLYILAARPAMGKSALALQFAIEAARNNPALFFSLEMPRQELAERAVSCLSGIPLRSIQDAQLEDEQWESLATATRTLNDMALSFDDSPRLHIQEIMSRCRTFKRKNGLSLVVIDYIQLVDGDGENNNLRVNDVSRRLKQLSKDLEVPVLAVSQLNRNLEARQDKRPMNSDLRDSGGLEQDADVICLLYRDEIYNPNTPHKNTAEFIISKNRSGPQNRLGLKFIGERTMFEDMQGRPPPVSNYSGNAFNGADW